MNNHPIVTIPVSELKSALVGLGKVLPRSSTLPVLTTLLVERDRQGWVHLTATDLDTFVSLRLEAPGQSGNATKLLVPFETLQKLGKHCPADEVLELEARSEDQILTRYHLGSHPVEQSLTVPLAADFPEAPVFTTAPVSLDEAARTVLLDALACASDDETRAILGGAYLDVSKPSGHYAVATDSRHLYASNSLHLALPTSVLVPDHRFLSWNGFVKDGQWKLSVQPATKDTGGFVRLESRRWSFTTKQVEGTYPNWRTITGDVQSLTGTLELSEAAVEAVQKIVPRLPGDEHRDHTIGLQVQDTRLFLRGWNQGQETPTDVEVPGVTITGAPAPVYLNRQYLLKALGFGLRQIGIQEALKPLRFSDGGSRQMIVMPVRVDGFTQAPVGLRTTPVSSTIPATASVTAAPDQPTTLNPNSQPPTPERNIQPMQNTTTSSSGHQPGATTDSTSAPEEKNSLEQALDQIEAVRGTLRGAVASLNTLADTLRQVQRERRVSEREIRSVRGTLKALQTVRL